MTSTTKSNGFADEILRKLTNEEIDELFQLYKNKYTANNFHYLLIYNQIKWNRQLQQRNIDPDDKEWLSFRKSFYTHRNCDFRKYGTYVSLHWDMIQSVSCHSWEPSLTELEECLSKTQLIDWKNGPLLTTADLSQCDLLKKIALMSGTSIQLARRCYGLFLPHKKALSLKLQSLPDGYVLKQLCPADAKKVYSTWVNQSEASLQYVQNLIKIDRSLGIFNANTNELEAWIMQNEFSGIGFLEVCSSERRKGFGHILTSYMCKNVAEYYDMDVSVWIRVENFKSEGLLEKIGFKKYVINEWIQLNKVN